MMTAEEPSVVEEVVNIIGNDEIFVYIGGDQRVPDGVERVRSHNSITGGDLIVVHKGLHHLPHGLEPVSRKRVSDI